MFYTYRKVHTIRNLDLNFFSFRFCERGREGGGGGGGGGAYYCSNTAHSLFYSL